MSQRSASGVQSWVFNVVGEILPPNEIERILRDYYAGKIGNADLEERLLRDVKEDHFRAICQNALEGLATKKLNLENADRAQSACAERRVVPETIARFIKDSAPARAFDSEDVRYAAVHIRADRHTSGSSPSTRSSQTGNASP